MPEQKFTIEEINKGLDIYMARLEKNVNKMKVVGIPKNLHKSMLNKRINEMRAGMLEIRISLEHALNTGKLPDESVIVEAKRKHGFIIPNAIPQDLGGKTVREKQFEDLENAKKATTGGGGGVDEKKPAIQ